MMNEIWKQRLQYQDHDQEDNTPKSGAFTVKMNSDDEEDDGDHTVDDDSKRIDSFSQEDDSVIMY